MTISNTRLRSVIRVLLYVSFFTPLLVSPQGFIYPFVVPKVVFLRILAVLSLSLYAAIFIADKKYSARPRLKQEPLFWIVMVYWFTLAISTVFGVDFLFSFWSNHERMLGFFTISHYIGLFVVARYAFTSWKDWRRAFVVFTAVGIVSMGIALIQYIQPEFLYNRGASRVVGTLGNPIYVGGYGLFLLFISTVFFLKEKGLWRWYFLASGVLGFMGIVVSGTRGTLLGLCGALLIMFVLYTFGSHRSKAWYTLLAVVCLFASALGFTYLFKNETWVKELPLLGRVSEFSLTDRTGKTRLMAWKIAGQAWVEHPVFGWGPNNYYYAFSKYYDPAFAAFGTQETWFDNAHNIFMNTLANQGAVGLVSYLGLYGAAGFVLLRHYRRDKEQNMHVAVVLTGFLVAHGIHNFFVFENATSYLYFFLLLAFIDGLPRLGNETTSRTTPTIPLIAGVVIVGLIVIFTTNINVVMANYFGGQGRIHMGKGQLEESMAAYKTGRAWRSPYQEDMDWTLATDVLMVLPRVYSFNTTTARLLYDEGVSGMEKIVAKHPLDVRARLVYMDLLRSGGMVLFEVPGAKEIVEAQLKIAEELSPHRQQVEYSRITFLAGSGEIDKAIEMTKKLIERDPNIADGYFTLGRLYHFQGQYKQILATMDTAILAGIRWSDMDQQIFAAETYEREGRFSDALYWYDSAYRATGNERIKNKRDELSKQTAKPVPTLLEDFFPFPKN